MKTKNRRNNNKGIALVIVMMIMLVMSLIGGAFVSVSAYQHKQAINEDKGLKAHYLARAGAEAALQAWQDAPSTSKPVGAFDPVYLNASNGFDAQATNSKGNFVVTITNPTSLSTFIRSVGTVGDKQETVSVTINTVIDLIPGPTPTYVDGRLTGFYDYTSGQLNHGEFPHDFNHDMSTKGTVKNEALHAKGLKIPNKNSDSAKLTFERMLFSSTFQVIHNSVILKSNIIVFTDPIDFSANSNSEGDLTLEAYGSGGDYPEITPVTATINYDTWSGDWGVLIIDGVGYYYKDIHDGVQIKSEADITTHINNHNMYPILDPDELNMYLSEVVPTTLSVTSYSILWSK